MGPDKKKELEKAYQKMLAISTNQASLDGIQELVATDVMGFGTTIDEEIHSLEGYIDLIKTQEEQAKAAGFEFSFETEQIHHRISPEEDSALFVELMKAMLKSDGKIVQQFTFRFTAVMEYLDEQWKLVHWHGSVPTETENDTWHINEVQKEKERLEKLVAEQTTDLQNKNQELEIEAAVERVRAHAMGMQKPDDMMNVLKVISDELEKFALENVGTWFWIFNDDNTLTQWDISELGPDGTLANVNVTLDLEKSASSKKHAQHWTSTDYYNMLWEGAELQQLVNEVKELDPESGAVFQELVDTGQMETYWQACAPFSRGVLGLDYPFEPPESAKPILKKMSSAFDMAYRRFEDLQKAEAQTREAQINLAVERVRARALAMYESEEILEVVKKLRDEIMGLEIPNVTAATIHLKEPDGKHRAWDLTSIADDGNDLEISLDIQYRMEDTHPDFFMREVWAKTDDYFVVIQGGDRYKHTVQWLQQNGYSEYAQEFEEFLESSQLDRAYHPTVPLSNGRMNIDMLEPPEPEVESILKKMAGAFDLAYKRFEDLKKSEQQAYESKVEASLERVRGMAAAMNHSDDLMQIAEAMFKELEILKINPLRYGLGMIDGKNKEAELWASTVNDGHYLDMLGTLSLTWHPMLVKVLDAWDAQHEELIYELKGQELSDYYQKVGPLNPEIPNLKALQDPETKEVQYVSFFPFKSGALYAFTGDDPSDEGKTILKRFANVFEQAHIRYHDLQVAEEQARLIREERDRLEVALSELEATKDQLVQQEKLASLGQLTAGIAHEIKNPLNFVNNFSELSEELIQEAREEIKSVRAYRDTPLPDDALDEMSAILNDIEANLKTIHKHGSRADSIVKSMLQHSRGGDGKMEPTPLNPLIKEYVNLAFHGMRAGKEPINVDIDLQLDNGVDEVPLIAEDFSRVILNLVNNAFDAMHEKTLQGFGTLGGLDEYHPKLTVRTHQTENTITIEIEDNGPGIPDEMKDKILQPFFTTKKGTAGTGLGLSITNDIIKAHGGSLDVQSQSGKTVFVIKLNR